MKRTIPLAERKTASGRTYYRPANKADHIAFNLLTGDAHLIYSEELPSIRSIASHHGVELQVHSTQSHHHHLTK